MQLVFSPAPVDTPSPAINPGSQTVEIDSRRSRVRYLFAAFPDFNYDGLVSRVLKSSTSPASATFK
jgi:hypothetical protein